MYDQWEATNFAFLDDDDAEGNPLMPELDGDTLILRLYSPILPYREFVSPAAFVDAMNGHDGPITLYVNSPGGEVTAGWTIRNMLARHPGKVTAIVDGLAGSIASAILTGCAERFINTGAMIMMHRAEAFVYGNGGVLQKRILVLDKLDDDLASAYASIGKDN